MGVSLVDVLQCSSRLMLLLMLLSLCANIRRKPTRATLQPQMRVLAGALAVLCASTAPLLIDSTYAFDEVKQLQPMQQAVDTFVASFRAVGTKPSISALLHKVAVAMATNDSAADLVLLLVGCAVFCHLTVTFFTAPKGTVSSSNSSAGVYSGGTTAIALVSIASAGLLVRGWLGGSLGNAWLLQICCQVVLILTVWDSSRHSLHDVTATLACLHSVLKLVSIGMALQHEVVRPNWGLAAGVFVALFLPMLGKSGRTFKQAWGVAVVLSAVMLGAVAKCDGEPSIMRKIQAGCMLAQAITGICTVFLSGTVGIAAAAVVFGGLCTAYHVQIQGLSFPHH